MWLGLLLTGRAKHLSPPPTPQLACPARQLHPPTPLCPLQGGAFKPWVPTTAWATTEPGLLEAATALLTQPMVVQQGLQPSSVWQGHVGPEVPQLPLLGGSSPGLMGPLGQLAYLQHAFPQMRPMDSQPAVAAQQAAQEYMAGVQSGGAVSSRARESETQRRKAATWAEFQGWYDRIQAGLGGMQRAVEAAPVDLIAFAERRWLPQHGETLLQGQIYAAPSSLEAMFSQLSSVFEMAGRVGPYGTGVSGAGLTC